MAHDDTPCTRMGYAGHLGGSVVGHLRLAQGVIQGSWNQVPHWAPLRESASPSACVSASLFLSLFVFHERIKVKSLKKKKEGGGGEKNSEQRNHLE